MIGATGDVGRQICVQLIERRIVGVTSRMQLVARSSGSSARAAHGLRTDLIDAYAEHAPLLDVALHPDEVVADVIVMAAGQTLPTTPGARIDRRSLAAANLAIFQSYARAIAADGAGHEVVIVVSNPVELAVAAFAAELGRHRVIGMGAWLDTLRFRREIATSLGVRRQSVGGFVVGQHGDDMVPLWSSVRITGQTVPERAEAVAALRGARSMDDFGEEVARAKHTLAELAVTDLPGAFGAIDAWPPDLRTVARPWLTHQSGAKTSSGTAGAAVDLVDTVFDGRDIVVAGQVALDGEIEVEGSPVRTAIGVPIVLGPEGWSRVLLDPLAPDESRRLAATVEHIETSHAAWGVG